VTSTKVLAKALRNGSIKIEDIAQFANLKLKGTEDFELSFQLTKMLRIFEETAASTILFCSNLEEKLKKQRGKYLIEYAESI
jgi:hypothetical protein